jgi:hypothetical protein
MVLRNSCERRNFQFGDAFKRAGVFLVVRPLPAADAPLPEPTLTGTHGWAPVNV